MRSIRERILKDDQRGDLLAALGVAVRSIRERILKVLQFVDPEPLAHSCSEVDPGEDTERGLRARGSARQQRLQ